jgi:type II secretory ATPase GspE/PulE/Tfp pilus assembly ATPase PilB-like protein
LLLSAALVLCGAGPAWAAGAAAGAAAATAWRGPGGYLSPAKVVVCLLLLALWIRAADWINRDSQKLYLPCVMWNTAAFAAFLGGALLFWLLPWFWLGLLLLLIAVAAPLTGYLLDRQAKVANRRNEATDSVLDLVGRVAADAISVAAFFGVMLVAGGVTSAVAASSGTTLFLIRLLSCTAFVALVVPLYHQRLSDLIAEGLGRLASLEKADPNVQGAPVSLFARGGPDDRTDAGRLMAARQSPGLRAAREILADGVSKRATALMLDFAVDSVSVRHLIDGVWLPQESRDRPSADGALEALKVLCGLNPKDRQKRQEGQFGVEYAVFRPEVFDRVARAREDFKEKVSIEVIKKGAAEREANPAEWEHRLKTEVEERTRQKFSSPVGPWTPVDRTRLPKLPGVEQINPLNALETVKYPATLAAQGTKTGERVLVQFEIKPLHLKTLADLGMREKMQEQLKELTQRTKGFLLFSAIPGGGLRTTLEVVLNGMDRFLREFAGVEEESGRAREVENIAITTYKAAAGQTPAAVLPKIFHAEPNVVVVRDLPDAETVRLICREVAEADRLVMGTVRAKDCAEALLRILLLKAPPAEVAAAISAVLCQRLVRKLCDLCKEPYAPAPQVLQQLGIPPGRVRAFYRPHAPKPDEGKKDLCRGCGGVGYQGQTAIFELLVLDDGVRKVLAATPKLDVLRQAARKAGMKSLQEEGILLVARGVTSLPELMRVMKQ